MTLGDQKLHRSDQIIITTFMLNLVSLNNLNRVIIYIKSSPAVRTLRRILDFQITNSFPERTNLLTTLKTPMDLFGNLVKTGFHPNFC